MASVGNATTQGPALVAPQTSDQVKVQTADNTSGRVWSRLDPVNSPLSYMIGVIGILGLMAAISTLPIWGPLLFPVLGITTVAAIAVSGFVIAAALLLLIGLTAFIARCQSQSVQSQENDNNDSSAPALHSQAAEAAAPAAEAVDAAAAAASDDDDDAVSSLVNTETVKLDEGAIVFSHEPGSKVWNFRVMGADSKISSMGEMLADQVMRSQEDADTARALDALGYPWRRPEPAAAAAAAAAAAQTADAAAAQTAEVPSRNPRHAALRTEAAAIWAARNKERGAHVFNAEQLKRMREIDDELCKGRDQAGKPTVYAEQVQRVATMRNVTALPAFANGTLIAAHGKLKKEKPLNYEMRIAGITKELQKRHLKAVAAGGGGGAAAAAAPAAQINGDGNGPAAGESRLQDVRKGRVRRPGKARK